MSDINTVNTENPLFALLTEDSVPQAILKIVLYREKRIRKPEEIIAIVPVYLEMFVGSPSLLVRNMFFSSELPDGPRECIRAYYQSLLFQSVDKIGEEDNVFHNFIDDLQRKLKAVDIFGSIIISVVCPQTTPQYILDVRNKYRFDAKKMN